MANELVLNADPGSESGLTVTADVYGVDGVAVSTGVTMTEVGSTAIYRGNMPSAGAGTYLVRYFNGATLLGREDFQWSGTAEVTLQTLNSSISTLLANVANVDSDVAALNDLSAQDVRDALQLTATDGKRSIDKLLAEIEGFFAVDGL